jgi:hypothetical protein
MRYREKTKKRPVELIIRTKILKKPKKKVKLNKDIEKEHPEKEYIPNEMLNVEYNTRFSR